MRKSLVAGGMMDSIIMMVRRYPIIRFGLKKSSSARFGVEHHPIPSSGLSINTLGTLHEWANSNSRPVRMR